ncbi:hypothetical protein M407DRAFT_22922 [Tulasnella calospora MUT 4182]|uniref:Uncharacterized protein n=1 Tax=Tulasnella calospora MUT 4182 TaxID=1051891 RepID=A0A0C3QM64_9AGAM|nr:hypothetical protein M407DRAFT_22922 [Tulasnella calospora MUT 4182]
METTQAYPGPMVHPHIVGVQQRRNPTLTQARFKEPNNHLIRKTVKPVNQVSKDVGTKKDDSPLPPPSKRLVVREHLLHSRNLYSLVLFVAGFSRI